MLSRTRVVLAATVALFGLMAGPLSAASAKAPKNAPNLIPFITEVKVLNGKLVASGNISAGVRGRKVATPFTGVAMMLGLATEQTGADPNCPILHLHLAPTNLNLPGLLVQTGSMCLTIDASEGVGAFGDVLCSIAVLLDQGQPLSQILAGLNAKQLETLTKGAASLLNSALSRLNRAVLTEIDTQQRPLCDILHLELGPLDLTYRGLELVVDDCSGDPVTMHITPIRGDLLGDTLCNLLDSDRIALGLRLNKIVAGLNAAAPR